MLMLIIAARHGLKESYLFSFNRLVRQTWLRFRAEAAKFAMDNFIV